MATSAGITADADENIYQDDTLIEMKPETEQYMTQAAIYHAMIVYRTSILHSPLRAENTAYADLLIHIINKQIERSRDALHRIAHQEEEWDGNIRIYSSDDPTDVVHLTCTLPTH